MREAGPYTNNFGRFSNRQVIALRAEAAVHPCPRELVKVWATSFDVGRDTIRSLLTGRNYGSVPGALTPQQLGFNTRVGQSKLTPDQVLAARRRYRRVCRKVQLKDFAEKLGIGLVATRKMLLGETYSHVPEALQELLGNKVRRQWSEKTVIEMRRKYPERGVTLHSLSQEYGGNIHSIGHMLLGRTYSEIPGRIETLKPAGMKEGDYRNLNARTLDDDAVILMREQFRNKEATIGCFAARHDLTAETIRQILLGRTYKELPGALDRLSDTPVRRRNALTDAKVREYRSSFRSGRMMILDISAMAGIGPEATSHMLRGRTYSHVSGAVKLSMKEIWKRRVTLRLWETRERERKIKAGIPLRPLIPAAGMVEADHDPTVDRRYAA